MNLKLRTYLSALLLLVYGLSVGGTLLGELACHCPMAAEAHLCCQADECREHPDCATHTSDFHANGCAMDHASRADLYLSETISSPERQHAVATLDLLFASAAIVDGSQAAERSMKFFEQPPASLHDTYAHCVGLRAPPVFV